MLFHNTEILYLFQQFYFSVPQNSIDIFFRNQVILLPVLLLYAKTERILIMKFSQDLQEKHMLNCTKIVDRNWHRWYSIPRKKYRDVPYGFLFGMGMPTQLIVWRFLIVTESCLLWGKGSSSCISGKYYWHFSYRNSMIRAWIKYGFGHTARCPNPNKKKRTIFICLYPQKGGMR